MKSLLLALLLTSASCVANAQTKQQKEIKKQLVEIACGECQFKMKGKSCDLAIRIDGKPYFVDGKNIDEFGDAHDKEHGFCNVIQKAEVTGKIVKNRFKATDIKLVTEKK